VVGGGGGAVVVGGTVGIVVGCTVGIVVGAVDVVGAVGTVEDVGGSVTVELPGKDGTEETPVGSLEVVWLPVVSDGGNNGLPEEASGSMAQPLKSNSTSSMESSFFIKTILRKGVYYIIIS
jgi:hypothetical protein